MAAVDYTAYFRGKVLHSNYTQALSVEPGYRWSGAFETQTFEFEGLTSAQAHYRGEVTVTDVDGNSYTFYLKEAFTDSSSGPAVFEKEVCRVDRRRTSPHMWSVTFTRTGGKLLNCGIKYLPGPEWMDDYNV